MWEDSFLRKPHFSAISGLVILMRDLIAGYVIFCGTGKHWKDSSVNNSHLSTNSRIGGVVKRLDTITKGPQRDERAM